MSYYFLLIGIIVIEWIMLFPNLIIKFELPKNRKKIFLILVCIELVIFVGFRGFTIGADTVVYLKAFNYYKGISFFDVFTKKLVYPFDFEIGYFIFSKICSFLMLSNTLFLIVVAAFIYIPLCKFIYDFSKNSLISILLYFSLGLFAYSLGIFRQMIAMSIILQGYQYILKREPIKYITIVLFASLFHTTALVTIFLYWITKIDFSKKISLVYSIELILFMFPRSIVLLIIKIFSRYNDYIGSMYDIQGGSYIMLILLNIIFILCYFFIKNNLLRNNSHFKICTNALVIAIFLQSLSYSFGIFGRIVPYFSIYLLIIIPTICKNLVMREKSVYMFALIIMLIFIFYISTKNNIYITPFYFNKYF